MSVPVDERTSVARQALVEILRENGPQLGAKLKVRLTVAIGRRLGLPSHQWYSLIPRLSNFLAAHSDLVSVERPDGPGDIRVSLREAVRSTPDAQTESARVWYRPDVWTAFINPDPVRRRFFHRGTYEIVHFLNQSSAPPNPDFARRVHEDPAFVEIRFADAPTQTGWMREFLETTPLISEAHKRTARHFLELPFDSSINTAFTLALGPHADAWKRFRTNKVDEYIKGWARTNGISPEFLQGFPGAGAPFDATRSLQEPALPPSSAVAEHAPQHVAGDLRSTLRGIVDVLDDAELRLVLVPLSAIERVLRARS